MDPTQSSLVSPLASAQSGTGQGCGGCLPIQHKDLLSPLPCLPGAGELIPAAVAPQPALCPPPVTALHLPGSSRGNHSQQKMGTAGRELFLQPQQDGHHTHGGGRDAKSPSSSQEHLNPKVRVIDPSFHAPGLQLTLPFVSHMSHVSHGLCHSSAAFAAFPERGGFVHRSKAQGLGTTAGEREGRAAGVPCSWQHLSPPACPHIPSVPQMLSPAPQMPMPWDEKELPWRCCAAGGCPTAPPGEVPSVTFLGSPVGSWGTSSNLSCHPPAKSSSEDTFWAPFLPLPWDLTLL